MEDISAKQRATYLFFLKISILELIIVFSYSYLHYFFTNKHWIFTQYYRSAAHENLSWHNWHAFFGAVFLIFLTFQVQLALSWLKNKNIKTIHLHKIVGKLIASLIFPSMLITGLILLVYGSTTGPYLPITIIGFILVGYTFSLFFIRGIYFAAKHKIMDHISSITYAVLCLTLATKVRVLDLITSNINAYFHTHITIRTDFIVSQSVWILEVLLLCLLSGQIKQNKWVILCTVSPVVLSWVLF